MDEHLERKAWTSTQNAILACMRQTLYMQWLGMLAFAVVGLSFAAVVAFGLWVCMSILHAIGGP